MSAQIVLDHEALSRFCERWGVVELALFGSVLREDFGPDSDVDVLVTFAPEARRTIFDLVRMRAELSQLFGREVDLVSRRGVEASRNPFRRQEILSSAERVYVA